MAVLYLTTENNFAFLTALGMIIYGFFSAIMVYCSGKRLKVSADEPGQITVGEPADFSFIIDNLSLIPVFRSEIEVKVTNLLNGQEAGGRETVSLNPRRGSRIFFRTEGNHCGYVRAEVTDGVISDPLGLFTKRADVKKDTGCYVYPGIGELPISAEQLDRYDMESYKFSSTKPGDDFSEIFGIREYAPGDSIKRIHWKLSGKLGDVMVRIPGLPVENSLLIILDKGKTGTPEEIDRVIELYLSLSSSLIKQDFRHSIGWYNYDAHEFTVKNISSREDVFACIPELISSPFVDDESGTVTRFLESENDNRFAVYMYVTIGSDAEKEVEKLREYGDVDIYRPEQFQ